MNIKVLYFARLRDELGLSEESVPTGQATRTLGHLREYLSERGPEWRKALHGRGVFAAVNQQIADWDTALTGNEEVAFFPPVTGG